MRAGEGEQGRANTDMGQDEKIRKAIAARQAHKSSLSRESHKERRGNRLQLPSILIGVPWQSQARGIYTRGTASILRAK